jgi:hypothetical protein
MAEAVLSTRNPAVSSMRRLRNGFGAALRATTVEPVGVTCERVIVVGAHAPVDVTGTEPVIRMRGAHPAIDVVGAAPDIGVDGAHATVDVERCD